MIRVSQLRIGNWVNRGESTEESNYQRVYNLVGGSRSERSINEYPEDDYEAIRLTPAILTKCGFEEIAKNFYFPLGACIGKLVADSDNDILCVEYVTGDYALANPVYYVHQLQNLYFSLTGKEFKLDL